MKLEDRLWKELNEILDQIETLWFQKSRMKATRDEDKNTRYFHLSTIIRRKRTRIKMLMDDGGNWINDQEAIKRHVVRFLENCSRIRNPLHYIMGWA